MECKPVLGGWNGQRSLTRDRDIEDEACGMHRRWAGEGAKAEGENSSVELKSLRVSNGGNAGRREGRREVAESGRAVVESREPC